MQHIKRNEVPKQCITMRYHLNNLSVTLLPSVKNSTQLICIQKVVIRFWCRHVWQGIRCLFYCLKHYWICSWVYGRSQLQFTSRRCRQVYDAVGSTVLVAAVVDSFHPSALTNQSLLDDVTTDIYLKMKYWEVYLAAIKSESVPVVGTRKAKSHTPALN